MVHAPQYLAQHAQAAPVFRLVARPMRNARYSTSVLAATASPFYVSVCSPVACAANTAGVNIVAGCSCDACYYGSVSQTSSSPYCSGLCAAVACPANANGTNVAGGCFCNSGYSGYVAALSKLFSGLPGRFQREQCCSWLLLQ